MKYLLAFLLVSLAGCVGDSGTEAIEGYEFPLLGNGTKATYETTGFLTIDGVTETFTNTNFIEIIYNDFLHNGEPAYIQAIGFESFTLLDLIGTIDHKRTSVIFQFDFACEVICEEVMDVSLGNAYGGYPVPLSTGQTWQNGDATLEVLGTKLLQTAVGSRMAIGLKEIVHEENQDIEITTWIDTLTGLELRLDGTASGLEGTGSATKELVSWDLQDVERTSAEAIQIAKEIQFASGFDPGYAVAVIDAPSRVDMDVEQSFDVVLTGAGDREMVVTLDGQEVARSVSAVTITPTYPGVYVASAWARDGPAEYVDERIIKVEGTISVTSTCQIGVSEMGDVCSSETFTVPPDMQRLMATTEAGILLDSIVLFDGELEYQSTDASDPRVIAIDPPPGQWTATYKPTISGGDSQDILIHLIPA